jgi:hypothetical protein
VPRSSDGVFVRRPATKPLIARDPVAAERNREAGRERRKLRLKLSRAIEVATDAELEQAIQATRAGQLDEVMRILRGRPVPHLNRAALVPEDAIPERHHVPPGLGLLLPRRRR